MKSLWARKASLLLSTVAIVLGTAFVAGSFTFTDMLQSSFRGILNGSVADINVGLKGSDTSMVASSRSIGPADIEKIRKVDGVGSAYGTISAYDIHLLNKQGKAMGTGGPGIGTNYVDAPAAGGQKGLVIKSGRAPEKAGEIVVDPDSLQKGGYALGDTVRFITSGEEGRSEAKVVGTALYGSKGSTAGAAYAIFHTSYAQKLFMEGKDAYQGVWVTVKDGADVKAVNERVGKVLPQGFEAQTGEEMSKKLNEVIATGMKFITYFLLFFAGVALLVGAFLIFNTFTILVAQRGRELALFRAMGASKGQVVRSVLLESIVLGLFGSTGGLLVGFALAKGISLLFTSLGMDMGAAEMQLTPSALLATYSLGMTITVFSAMAPAVRASRVPPVAAMSGEVMTGASGLGWRAVVGGLITTAGTVSLFLGLFRESLDNRFWYIIAGVVLMMLGAAAISPIIGAPVVWLTGRVNVMIFGMTGRLAEVNAARNPRRTAVTASALMIGLTLVTTVGTAAESMKASLGSTIEKSVRADFLVQNMQQQPIPVSIGNGMEKVNGVKTVHRIRNLSVTRDSRPVDLAAMKPESFNRVIKQTMTSGAEADFKDGTVLLSEDYSKNSGLKKGDKFTAVFQEKPFTWQVAGVFSTEKGTGVASVVTTLSTLETLGVKPSDGMVSINLAPGADKAAVRSGLEKVLEDMPLASIVDQREFVQSQNKGLDQMLMLIYGLLGLAIVIAILGIVNTLGLSIIERTREIGLLRAVGLNRGQVRRMIVMESTTIALLGAVLGLAMGMLFGYAIQQSLRNEGLSQLAFPWSQIVGSFVVALIIGALAGLAPAVRAAKLDVLKAIATE